MRANLFTHLQTLSFSFYNVTPVGYLLSRVMSDTSRIASMVAWNLTDILWAMFYVLGTFAAMLLLNWKLALCRYRHQAGHRRAHGLFSESHPALEPPRPQAELPHHRRVQRGHHRRENVEDLGIEEQNTASFRALTKEMHDCGIRAARLNAVLSPSCCSAPRRPWPSCCCAAAIWCRSRCCRSPRSRPSRPTPSAFSSRSR